MPLFTLLFDLTVNEGWNLIAITMYTIMLLLLITALRELFT